MIRRSTEYRVVERSEGREEARHVVWHVVRHVEGRERRSVRRHEEGVPEGRGHVTEERVHLALEQVVALNAFTRFDPQIQRVFGAEQIPEEHGFLTDDTLDDRNDGRVTALTTTQTATEDKRRLREE